MSTTTEACKSEDRPLFDRVARWTERRVGSSSSFMLAITVVVVWALSGPLFHWSDTWQLVINTGTTIITFLMVFLIQSTQSRDTRAVHLKLDELIRANRSARNSLFNLEDMSEAQQQQVRETFDQLGTGHTADGDGIELEHTEVDRVRVTPKASRRSEAR